MPDEEAYGLLLYGYSSDDAALISSSFTEIAGGKLDVIGASGCGDALISEILSDDFVQQFGDQEDRIIMLLGFSMEQTQKLLRAFPDEKGVKRPIFCGLTENNYTWKMKDLIAHLREENEYWKNKGQK